MVCLFVNYGKNGNYIAVVVGPWVFFLFVPIAGILFYPIYTSANPRIITINA